MDPFFDFVLATREEVEKMLTFMSYPLEESNPAVLARQLVEAESYYARAATILADTTAHLEAAECESLPPVGTELERKTKVKGKTIDHRRHRAVLEGLCKALTNRVSLGQSLLRSREREFQNTMRKA